MKCIACVPYKIKTDKKNCHNCGKKLVLEAYSERCHYCGKPKERKRLICPPGIFYNHNKIHLIKYHNPMYIYENNSC